MVPPKQRTVLLTGKAGRHMIIPIDPTAPHNEADQGGTFYVVLTWNVLTFMERTGSLDSKAIGGGLCRWPLSRQPVSTTRQRY